ncbi:hypothetical protein EON65_37850 [archaeon]|nr:MAG: hypothetical protein EON65_37850 [archaeon]
MASQSDLDRLIAETTSLAQRRAGIEVELRQLSQLEHKQQGEIAKLSKKVQSLAEQLHITQTETASITQANAHLQNEHKVLKEASNRMEQSLASLLKEIEEMKRRLVGDKSKYEEEYQKWNELINP